MLFIRIPCLLPGAGNLEIQLWDQENFLSDQLIGQTEIDLENRFYSTKWRSLSEYPIETRSLYHPSSKLEQGSIRLWVEIIPKDDLNFKKNKKEKRDITLKPPGVNI